MAKFTISPKENYLRLGRGEMPEWVPNPMMMGGDGPTVGVGPGELFRSEGQGGFMWQGEGDPPTEWLDIWGTPYIANFETGWQGLARPYDFILDDINNWEKVVKWPDKDLNIDWEARAKADLDKIDRSKQATSANAFFMPFNHLVGFMGFTEGLVAMSEEPEKVKEMLNYMCDWVQPIVENIIEYYNPDLLSLGDDTAAKYAPFFSVEMYKDIYKPLYARLTKKAQDRGIMVEFHNCGRCEDFIPDMIDFGVHYWNPAQTTNDLLDIKAKYKNFAIVGGWDFVPNPDEPITEELVKASVRESIDKYAPGGGYAFAGGYLGRADQADEAAQINKWVSEEATAYGESFYQTH